MKAMFHVQSSQAAVVLMGQQRSKIIEEVVKSAEKLSLEKNDHAIFDHHKLGLKIVVQMQDRQIHIMTKREADAGGLPNKPRS
jgi:hypothetical protein